MGTRVSKGQKDAEDLPLLCPISGLTAQQASAGSGIQNREGVMKQH